MASTHRAQLLAETVGTAILLTTIIGSGIMAERLSPGNTGVALFGNVIPPASILFVLITLMSPISGAHFNPAVTLAFYVRKEIKAKKALQFVLCQFIGAIIGTLIAHWMFEVDIFQISQKVRFGTGQWASEIVATMGLLLTIFVCSRHKPGTIPAAIALYITASSWFTASFCFANPAVSLGRCLSDTFAGIRPLDAGLFSICELASVFLALPLAKFLLEEEPE